MSLETQVASEERLDNNTSNNNNNTDSNICHSSDNNRKQLEDFESSENKRIPKIQYRALNNQKEPSIADQYPIPLLKQINATSSANSIHRSVHAGNNNTLSASSVPGKTRSKQNKSNGHPYSNSYHQTPRQPRSCGSINRQRTLPSPCHSLVEQIIHTVGELEQTLIEDHQNDFELRMALQRQTEQVRDLRSSLNTEKQRNERLVQLIRGVDSASSTEEDEQYLAGGVNYMNDSRWHSRTSASMNAFESISPLLMQQRYDELVLSHKQCRKQLIKKEKLLKHIKCEKEDFEGRYDHLLDEYRTVQKRFEELCCMYLRLQAKKNAEILKLREALNYASDCVISVQQLLEQHNVNYNDDDDVNKDGDADKNASCGKEFRQNLQLFIKTLRSCECAQISSNRKKEKEK